MFFVYLSAAAVISCVCHVKALGKDSGHELIYSLEANIPMAQYQSQHNIFLARVSLVSCSGEVNAVELSSSTPCNSALVSDNGDTKRHNNDNSAHTIVCRDYMLSLSHVRMASSTALGGHVWGSFPQSPELSAMFEDNSNGDVIGNGIGSENNNGDGIGRGSGAFVLRRCSDGSVPMVWHNNFTTPMRDGNNKYNTEALLLKKSIANALSNVLHVQLESYAANEITLLGNVQAKYTRLHTTQAATGEQYHYVKEYTQDQVVASADVRLANPTVAAQFLYTSTSHIHYNRNNGTIIRVEQETIAGSAAQVGDGSDASPFGRVTSTLKLQLLEVRDGVQGRYMPGVMLPKALPGSADSNRLIPALLSVHPRNRVKDTPIMQAEACSDFNASAHACLIHIFSCFPHETFDDASDEDYHQLQSQMARCTDIFVNATMHEPLLLVEAAMMLARQPCHIADVFATAPHDIHIAQNDFSAALLQDVCNKEASSRVSTVLSDKLVSLMTGRLVTASGYIPSLQHLLVDMLRNPLAYRYDTIPEHIMLTIPFLQAPTQPLVEALIDISRAIDHGRLLSDSQPRALALSAAAAAARQARDFSARERMTLVPLAAGGDELAELTFMHVYDADAVDRRLMNVFQDEYVAVADQIHAAVDTTAQLSALAIDEWKTLSDQSRLEWTAVAEGVTPRIALALIQQADAQRRIEMEARAIMTLRDARRSLSGSADERHARLLLGEDHTSQAALHLRVLLQAVGNFGHEAMITFAVNHTNSPDATVQHAAIRALRNVGAHAELPRVHHAASPRTLVGGRTPQQPSAMPPQLFPELYEGVGAVTVESHFLQLLHHPDLTVRITTLETLHSSHSLITPAIVDTMLSLFEADFTGKEYLSSTTKEHVRECQQKSAVCAHVTAKICAEMCNKRVEASRREALLIANCLQRHVSDQYDFITSTAQHRRKLAVQDDAMDAVALQVLVRANTGVAARRRQLSALANNRQLYAPLSRHLSAARRLGIATLIDKSYNWGTGWGKTFGNNMAGVWFGAGLSSANHLRLGLFGGELSASINANGGVQALIWGHRIDMIYATAGLSARWAYVTSFANDLQSMVDQVSGAALSAVDTIASTVCDVIDTVRPTVRAAASGLNTVAGAYSTVRQALDGASKGFTAAGNFVSVLSNFSTTISSTLPQISALDGVAGSLQTFLASPIMAVATVESIINDRTVQVVDALSVAAAAATPVIQAVAVPVAQLSQLLQNFTATAKDVRMDLIGTAISACKSVTDDITVTVSQTTDDALLVIEDLSSALDRDLSTYKTWIQSTAAAQPLAMPNMQEVRALLGMADTAANRLQDAVQRLAGLAASAPDTVRQAAITSLKTASAGFNVTAAALRASISELWNNASPVSGRTLLTVAKEFRGTLSLMGAALQGQMLKPASGTVVQLQLSLQSAQETAQQLQGEASAKWKAGISSLRSVIQRIAALQQMLPDAAALLANATDDLRRTFAAAQLSVLRLSNATESALFDTFDAGETIVQKLADVTVDRLLTLTNLGIGKLDSVMEAVADKADIALSDVTESGVSAWNSAMASFLTWYRDHGDVFLGIEAALRTIASIVPVVQDQPWATPLRKTTDDLLAALKTLQTQASMPSTIQQGFVALHPVRAVADSVIQQLQRLRDTSGVELRQGSQALSATMQQAKQGMRDGVGQLNSHMRMVFSEFLRVLDLAGLAVTALRNADAAVAQHLVQLNATLLAMESFLDYNPLITDVYRLMDETGKEASAAGVQMANITLTALPPVQQTLDELTRFETLNTTIDNVLAALEASTAGMLRQSPREVANEAALLVSPIATLGTHLRSIASIPHDPFITAWDTLSNMTYRTAIDAVNASVTSCTKVIRLAQRYVADARTEASRAVITTAATLIAASNSTFTTIAYGINTQISKLSNVDDGLHAVVIMTAGAASKVQAMRAVVKDLADGRVAANRTIKAIQRIVAQQLDLERVNRAVQSLQADVQGFVSLTVQRSLQSVLKTFNDIGAVISTGQRIVTDVDSTLGQIVATMRTVSTGGLPASDLAPWQSLQWCDERTCLRIMQRSTPFYRDAVFNLRYLAFADAASPPLLGDREPRYRWTLPGVFEDWLPHGLHFYSESVLMVTMRGTGNNRNKASLLVVLDAADGSIRKILELYVDDSTPFCGDAAGVAVTPEWVWVTGHADLCGLTERSTNIIGFRNADLDAALQRGRQPERLYAATLPGGIVVQFDTGHIASALWFDPTVVDGNKACLYVVERYAPQVPGVPGSEETVKSAPSSVTGKRGAAACVLVNAAGYPVYSIGIPVNPLLDGVAVRHKIYVGPDVHGIVTNYKEAADGFTYTVVSRCSLRTGYECRVEFHQNVIIQNVRDIHLVPGDFNDRTASMSNVLRVPPAAAGLAFPLYGTGQRSFGLLIQGAAQYLSAVMSRGKLDVDDSIYKFRAPILRATPFRVFENNIRLTALGMDLVNQCLLPVGQACGGVAGTRLLSSAARASTAMSAVTETFAKASRAQNLSPSGTLSSNAARRHRSLMAAPLVDVHPVSMSTAYALLYSHTDTRALAFVDGDIPDPRVCLGRSWPLWQYKNTLFEASFGIPIAFITLSFRIYSVAMAQVEAGAGFCPHDRNVYVQIVPSAAVKVGGSVAVEIFIIKGGFGIEGTIADTALIPKLTVGPVGNGGMGTALTLTLWTRPLTVRAYVFFDVRLCFGFIEICCFFCFPFPFWPVWCGGVQFTLFTWGAAPIAIPIFSIQTKPGDGSPPIAGWVRAMQTSDVSLNVILGGAHDPDTGIDHYDVCVGSAAFSDNIIRCRNIGTSNSAAVAMPRLADRATFFVTAKAFNGALMATSFTSAPMQWDASPPRVLDLRLLRADGAYSSEAIWLGSPRELLSRYYIQEACADTSISLVDVSIGSAPGAADALGWHTAGNAVVLQQKLDMPIFTPFRTLQLSHGRRYFMNVKTRNSAALEGITSISFTTDFTPPAIAYLWDGFPLNSGFSCIKTATYSQWGTPTDAESGVVNITWALLTAGGAYVVPHALRPLHLTMEVLAVPLQHGSTYYTQLVTYNAAGLALLVTSRGFTVDVTPPAMSMLYHVDVDGPNWLHSIASEHIMSNNATVNCSPPLLLGGVTETRIAAPTTCSHQSEETTWEKFMGITSDSFAWWSELHRHEESRDMHTFRAIAARNGLLQLHARWAMGDSESFIDQVKVCVGSYYGACDVMEAVNAPVPRSSIALVPDVDITQLQVGVPSLQRFRQYWQAHLVIAAAPSTAFKLLHMTVRAINGAGLQAISSTFVGVLHDPTPPLVLSDLVYPSLKGGKDTTWRYDANTTHFGVQWDGAFIDQESYTTVVDIKLGSVPDGEDVNAMTRVTVTNCGWLVGGLKLQHGMAVYTTLTVWNNAGTSTTHAALPVYIDLTPPIPVALCGGTPPQTPDQMVSATRVHNPTYPGSCWHTATQASQTGIWTNWVEFVEDNSPIYTYEVALSFGDDLPDANFTVWQDAGRMTYAYVFAGPSLLQHNLTYVAALRARNYAGLLSEVILTAVTIDLTPPLISDAYILNAYIMSVRQSSGDSIEVVVAKASDSFMVVSAEVFEDVSTVSVCYVSVGSYSLGNDILERINANISWSGQSGIIAGVLPTYINVASGTIVHVSLSCVNTAGGKGVVAVAAVIMDYTPPDVVAVLDGISGTDIDYLPWHENTTLSAAWPYATDGYTSIEHCEAAVGTTISTGEGMSDISGGWLHATLSNITFDNMVLPSDIRLYTSVRCTDAAGLQSRARSSDGILFDRSGPTLSGSGIAAGTSKGASKYVASPSEVTCWLDGIDDAESGISNIVVGLASSRMLANAGVLDIAPFQPLDIQLGRTLFAGLALTDNSNIVCLSKVYNGAGMSTMFVSAASIIDSTPPICTELRILDAQSMDAISGNVSLSAVLLEAPQVGQLLLQRGIGAVLSCSDDGSGLSHVSISLGFSAYDGGLIDHSVASTLDNSTFASVWTDVLPADALGLHGRLIYSTATVMDRAGNTMRIVSTPVLLAVQAPVLQTSLQLLDASSRSPLPAFASNLTQMLVRWRINDVVAPAWHAEIGMIILNGSTAESLPLSEKLFALSPRVYWQLQPNFLPFRAVSPDATEHWLDVPDGIATDAGIMTAPAREVAVIVRAVNNFGLEARFRSAGIIIDTSPPNCINPLGSQAHILNAINGYQRTRGSLSVTWDCQDSGSGISFAEIAIEQYAAGAWQPVTEFFRIQTAVSGRGTIQHPALTDGTINRAVLRVFNGAGLYTALVSDSVTIDSTTPRFERVPSRLQNSPYLSANDIANGWIVIAGSLPVSAIAPIASMAVALMDGSNRRNETFAFDDRLIDISNITAGGYFQTELRLPRLMHAQLLFVRTTVQTLSGAFAAVTSGPFVVDETRPKRTATHTVATFTLPMRYADQAMYPHRVSNATLVIRSGGWTDAESDIRYSGIAITFSTPINCSSISNINVTLPPTGDVSVPISEMCNGTVASFVEFAENGVGLLVAASPASTTLMLGGLIAGRSAARVLQYATDPNLFATISWDNFRSDGVPASTFAVGVGSQPRTANLFSIADVPAVNGSGSVLAALPQLSHGTVVYATVYLSASGYQTVAASTTVTVDLTPPVIESVDVVLQPTASGHEIAVFWNCSDAETGVVSGFIRIFEAGEASRSTWLTIPLNSSVANRGNRVISAMPLPATVLHTTVECSNGAGRSSSRDGNAITRDDSPPGWITDTPPWLPPPSLASSTVVYLPVANKTLGVSVAAGRPLVLMWHATDGESGIASSTLCIGSSATVYDVLPCTIIAAQNTTDSRIARQVDQLAVIIDAAVSEDILRASPFAGAVLRTKVPWNQSSFLFVSLTVQNNAALVTSTETSLSVVDCRANVAELRIAPAESDSAIATTFFDTDTIAQGRRIALTATFSARASIRSIVLDIANVGNKACLTNVLHAVVPATSASVVLHNATANAGYLLVDHGSSIEVILPYTAAIGVCGPKHILSVKTVDAGDIVSDAQSASFYVSALPAKITSVQSKVYPNGSVETVMEMSSDVQRLAKLEIRLCRGAGAGACEEPWVRSVPLCTNKISALTCAAVTLYPNIISGVSYISQIRGVDAAGNAFSAASFPLLVDFDGLMPAKILQPSGWLPAWFVLPINISWSFLQNGAMPQVASYEISVAIQALANTTTLLNWTDITSRATRQTAESGTTYVCDISSLVSALPIDTQDVYRVGVRTTTVTGQSSVGWSVASRIDLTPPQIRGCRDLACGSAAIKFVRRSSSGWADIYAIGSLHEVSVKWNGDISDEQSGIASFNAQLWDDATNDIIASIHNILATETIVTFVTQLQEGQRVRARVVAMNGAKLSVTYTSNAVVVDTIAPITGCVAEASRVNASDILACNFTQRVAHVSDAWAVPVVWNVQDNPSGSGIATFTVRVCQGPPPRESSNPAPKADCIGSVRVSGTVSTVSVPLSNPLQLEGQYYSIVSATDYAGNMGHIASKGFRLDGTPPDTSMASLAAPASIRSMDSLEISWSGVTDSESAIMALGLCVQTSPSHGAPVCADWLPVRPTISIADMVADGYVTPTQMQELQSLSTTIAGVAPRTVASVLHIIPTLIFYNGAGAAARVQAAPVMLDSVAPVPGRVFDVSNEWFDSTGGMWRSDAEFPVQAVATAAVHRRSAAWPAWGAGISGIAEYFYAFGTSCGASDVVPRTSAGLKQSVSVSGLQLMAGQTYFTTVWAKSGAGMEARGCSRGLIVDTTSPLPGRVVCGTSNGTAAVYSADSSVQVTWDGFVDAQSGINRYFIRVCDAAQSSCAAPWSILRNVNQALVGITSTIEAGRTYLAQVKAEDYAGWSTIASCAGVTFDSSPPVAQSAQLNASIIADWRQLVVSWEHFWDEEAPLVKYVVSVGTEAGTNNLLGGSDLGLDTNFIPTAADLNMLRTQSALMTRHSMKSLRFFVNIIGVNAAGLNATRVLVGELDDSPPVAGWVRLLDAAAMTPALARDISTLDSQNGTHPSVALLDNTTEPRYQTAATTLSFAWAAFHDPESDVDFSYCIGSACGDCDLRGWTDPFQAVEEVALEQPTSAGNRRIATFVATALRMRNGASYTVSVSATNAAGLTSFSCSKAVLIDSTYPLQTSSIDDVLPAALQRGNDTESGTGHHRQFMYAPHLVDDASDRDLTGSTVSISFQLPEVYDGESGIASLSYAVVEAQALDNFIDAYTYKEESAGAPATQEFNTKYDNWANITSNAPDIPACDANMTIGCIPTRRLAIRRLTDNDTSVEEGMSVIIIPGSLGDSSENRDWVYTSPLAEHHVSRGYHGGGVTVPFTAVGASSNGTVDVHDLKLMDGSAYAVVLQVCNGAMQCKRFTSDGFTVDEGVPCIGNLHIVSNRTVDGGSGRTTPHMSEADILSKDASLYWSSLNSINITWQALLDPYMQHIATSDAASAICPDVGFFSPTRNASLALQLSITAIRRFAISVNEVIKATTNATAAGNNAGMNFTDSSPVVSNETYKSIVNSSTHYKALSPQYASLASPCCTRGMVAPERTVRSNLRLRLTVRPDVILDTIGSEHGNRTRPVALFESAVSQALYVQTSGDNWISIAPLHHEESMRVSLKLAEPIVHSFGFSMLGRNTTMTAFAFHGYITPSKLVVMTGISDGSTDIHAYVDLEGSIPDSTRPAAVVFASAFDAGYEFTNAFAISAHRIAFALTSQVGRKIAVCATAMHMRADDCASLPSTALAAQAGLGSSATCGVAVALILQTLAVGCEMDTGAEVLLLNASTLQPLHRITPILPASVISSTAFGSVLCAKADLLIVADPLAAGGRGRVLAFTVTDSGVPHLQCFYEGNYVDTLLGQGLDIVSAEQRVFIAAFYAVKHGGTTGAMILQVQDTAQSRESMVACTVVNVLVTDMPPADNNKTQATADKYPLEAARDYVLPVNTAPSHLGPRGGSLDKLSIHVAATESAIAVQTVGGNVALLRFCPRDSVRVPSFNKDAVLPFSCRQCPADENSFGGVFSRCVACNTSDVCVPEDAASSMNASLSTVNFVNGGHYYLGLAAVAPSGMALPAFSSVFTVDGTPPEGGIVMDGTGVRRQDGSSVDPDIDYTVSTESYSATWKDWIDNESGIAGYYFGLATSPCDGIFHRACEIIPQPHIQVSDGIRQPPARRTCSDLEVNKREAFSARKRYGSGSVASPFPFDAEADFDVRSLQHVGNGTTINITGLALSHGDVIYGCLVVENGAGHRTVVSTDGLVVDLTPPVIQYVADGFKLPDVDTQVYNDALMAVFQAYDYESVLSGMVWTHTENATAIRLLQANGTRVDWDALQQEVARSALTEFEQIGVANFAARLHLTLDAAVYYALVRVENSAGLRSRIYASNGVRVGKNEVAGSQTSSTVVAFDSLAISNASTNSSLQQMSGKPTVGALVLPPAAISTNQSIVAGVVKDSEVDTRTIVDPRNTTRPAQNMRFGDYHFTIKVMETDSDGAKRQVDSYQFPQPVNISMRYTASTNSSEPTAHPILTFFNLETQRWENARDTCRPPMEFVDYETSSYTVSICHLTQFALWYQNVPFALLRPAYALGNVTAMMDAMVAKPRTTAAMVTFPAGCKVVMDGSASYDSDGTIVMALWDVVRAPICNETEDALSCYMLGDSYLVNRTSLITETTALMHDGLWEFALTVVDNQGGHRTARQQIYVRTDMVAIYPSMSPRPASSDNQDQPWLLIGSGSGAVCVCALVLAAVVFAWRRKVMRSRKLTKQPAEMLQNQKRKSIMVMVDVNPMHTAPPQPLRVPNLMAKPPRSPRSTIGDIYPIPVTIATRAQEPTSDILSTHAQNPIPNTIATRPQEQLTFMSNPMHRNHTNVRRVLTNPLVRENAGAMPGQTLLTAKLQELTSARRDASDDVVMTLAPRRSMKSAVAGARHGPQHGSPM